MWPAGFARSARTIAKRSRDPLSRRHRTHRSEPPSNCWTRRELFSKLQFQKYSPRNRLYPYCAAPQFGPGAGGAGMPRTFRLRGVCRCGFDRAATAYAELFHWRGPPRGAGAALLRSGPDYFARALTGIFAARSSRSLPRSSRNLPRRQEQAVPLIGFDRQRHHGRLVGIGDQLVSSDGVGRSAPGDRQGVDGASPSR